MERLAELEVTKGCATEPLRFCPDRSVTRAEMAAFLVRAFDLEAAEPAGFTDTAGNTHEIDIDALAAAGVTVGCKTEPLSYCPSKSVTRAEMATFLARALGLVEVPKPVEEATEEEEESAGPAITVDPATVPFEGDHDFTITGTGFEPGSAVFVLICTIPGDPVTAFTPAEDLETAMARTQRSDCDLGTAQTVNLQSDGFFSVRRSAEIGTNFAWVASDAAETQSTIAPVFVVSPSRVTVGDRHGCILEGDATVSCGGYDSFGVSDPPDGTFSDISAGTDMTCGILTDGTVTCWGGNRWGQIDAPEGKFKAVHAGWSHSCGIRVDGTIECWGDDRYNPPPAGLFVSIDAGGYYFFQDVLSTYSCGIRTTGSLTCWGRTSASE